MDDVTASPVYLENVTADELTVGRCASLSRVLTHKDIELFATVSGDVNPAHMDPAYAKSSLFHGIIGHGMWSGALISTVLGTVLPGPGTIYLEQDMKFKKPVRLGDKITVKVTVRSKRADKPIVLFDCACTNELGEIVVEGVATVLAPTTKIRRLRPELPDVEIYERDHYRVILDHCRPFGPVRTAIVHPVEANALLAALDAAREGLILPVLVGPRPRIEQLAATLKADIGAWELIDTLHSHESAARAVELAASGKVDALMKGSLHTEELMEAVVPTSSGLRTERRMSHALVVKLPSYHKPLIVTDAALNIAPDLAIKADICQNAIELWHILFASDKPDSRPKVALLAAVETVTVRMQATLDAAALCKMADRGQIVGGILDGPLALDNAISPQALIDKDMTSSVTGDADILVVPEIESGNMLAKQMILMGHADAAGIILGARVPIILTSRSDNLRDRLLSCALAVVLAKARRDGKLK